ncbi:DMT family transporter [Exiguobacterium flavidum]|uniref:DMT family transporter n=1 Tax=Exiguobacterium flavidum TaxID=2184695 RepID=UPI000DF75575|nr:multidrug efflux SMR transporter [Exiguobacterium flavidum]
MEWIYLVLAGIGEMLGVLAINRLNQKRGVLSLVYLIASFGMSFLLLTLAMKELPMGVAYAVWTGLGASGGAILSMIVYKEPRDAKRLFFIGLIIASAVGLKILT